VQGFELAHMRRIERVGVVRDEPCTRHAQHVLQQHLRLKPWQPAIGQQAAHRRRGLRPAAAQARMIALLRLHAAAPLAPRAP